MALAAAIASTAGRRVTLRCEVTTAARACPARSAVVNEEAGVRAPSVRSGQPRRARRTPKASRPTLGRSLGPHARSTASRAGWPRVISSRRARSSSTSSIAYRRCRPFVLAGDGKPYLRSHDRSVGTGTPRSDDTDEIVRRELPAPSPTASGRDAAPDTDAATDGAGVGADSTVDSTI